VTAALIKISGHGELTLRSWGLLLIAIWLSVDLWAWLLPKADKYHLKFAIGWTATSVFLIGAMGIMWWLMDGKLQDQREDVLQNLVINHRPLVGKESDPLATLFMVTNNATFEVSGKHQLVCYLNHAVGEYGKSSIRNMWQTFMPDPITGQFLAAYSGGQPEILWGDIKIGTPISTGGDAETYEHCLSMLHFETDTDCIDLTLIFWYSLETQPLLRQEKDFRIVGKKEGTQFDWHPQPIKSKVDYCGVDPFTAKPPS